MGKSFWIILGVVIAAGLGLVLFAGSGSKNTDSGTTDSVLTVKEDDHKRGLAGSSVTLIEYADFECSACVAIFPVVDQMFNEFGDEVEFVARNFPLPSIHPNAMSSARAAEAAADQDAFWQMHDMLYERYSVWSSSTNATPIFESYAEELGLNVDQFREYAASQEALDHINDDAREGQSIGVGGTPTFFLNGEQLPTPRTLEEFRAVLQAAVDAATGDNTADTDTPTATEPVN